jgi:hypothetical protein
LNTSEIGCANQDCPFATRIPPYPLRLRRKLRQRGSSPHPQVFGRSLARCVVVEVASAPSTRPATDASGTGLLRYDLIVRRGSDQDPAIRIVDRVRGYPLLSWHGAVVRHLLESGVIPQNLSRAGRHRCDKWFVWHLILAATATKIALDQIGYLEPRLRSIFDSRKRAGELESGLYRR